MRGSGCALVRGIYLPTEKNGIVKDLFSKFGFIPQEKGGYIHWRDSRIASLNSAKELFEEDNIGKEVTIKKKGAETKSGT